VRVSGLIWLEDIVEKLERKHGVREEEVVQTLGNAPHIRFVESGHRDGEDVYAALGRTDAGRYLIVFFVHKRSGHALVVSARDMSDTERRRYEKR
jgi:uncharacterized protein